MSSENVDRLSNLPEGIASHILSLMPTKYAVQSSILSKQWRYSWMRVTNLNFEDIYTIKRLHSISYFIDWVLQLCKPSQLHLFRFHLYYDPQWSIVSNWIDKVVELNIRELDIRLCSNLLPFSVFTCKSLTKLTLNQNAYYPSDWDLSCPVVLPSLKTLDITLKNRSAVNAFKIIGGCPILESLSLVNCGCLHDEEQDYHFTIPTLKLLKLVLFSNTIEHKIVLQLPNLKHLLVGGQLSSTFVMEDVSSLVEACVSCFSMWVGLLKGLSGVKFLSFQSTSDTFHLPIFPNKRYLMLKMCRNFGHVFQFLESSPRLKHLYIKEPQYCPIYDWIEPTSVAACLLTSLTTIKFSVRNWSWKSDMPFLIYMLRNAEVLETLSVTWEDSKVEEESRFFEELLILPTASKCCEICFNGQRVPAASR